MNLEGIVLVTGSGFLRTYTAAGNPDNQQEDYGLYFVLHFHDRPDKLLTEAEISTLQRDGGVPVPSKRIIRRYKQPNPTVPKSVRGAASLESLGIRFPLTAASPAFPELNRLAALVYLNGRLDERYLIDISPGVSLRNFSNAERKRDLEILAGSFEQLRFRLHGTRELLVPDSAGNALGRLLYLMGVPRERKVTHAKEFPSHIMDISRNLREGEFSPTERSVLTGYCLDFIGILLATKGRIKYTPAGNPHFEFELPAVQSWEVAEQIAMQCAEMIKSATGLSAKALYERHRSIVGSRTERRNGERIVVQEGIEETRHFPVVSLGTRGILKLYAQHGPRGDNRINYSGIFNRHPLLEERLRGAS